MRSLLVRTSLVALAAFATGCGDPTSPTSEIAARFDALAAKLTVEDQHRQEALLIAAHTLRRGAPLNTINMAVGTEVRSFNAVAIQIGFDGDPDFMGTTVIAWRGRNAEELLHLRMFGSELQFADTTGAIDPGYIGNLLYDHFYFMKDTSELWYRRSGEGNLDVISEGASCQPRSSTHTCQAIRVAVDFAVKTRLAVDDASIRERVLMAPRVTLKAIRYRRKCELSGTESSSCHVSLISE